MKSCITSNQLALWVGIEHGLHKSTVRQMFVWKVVVQCTFKRDTRRYPVFSEGYIGQLIMYSDDSVLKGSGG